MYLLIAILLACSLVSPARAVMVSEITPDGYHLIHDTNTSLTWLSLIHTFALPRTNYIDLLMQPGGPYAEYRYATVSEVFRLLLDEYDMNLNWHESSIPGMRRFFDDFFILRPEGFQRVNAFFDPHYMEGFLWMANVTVFSDNSAYFDVQLWGYPISLDDRSGIMLVKQTTPEPSTLLLIASGLFFIFLRRKTKN